MKKTANRVLAVALAFLLAFSCLTVAFAADGDKTNNFGYASRGISEFVTNDMSITYLANMLDDMLREMAEEDTENHSKMTVGPDIEKAIAESTSEGTVKALKILPVFKNLTNLTIDYSSIDAIMETADEIFVIWNGGTVKLLSLALGDIRDFQFNEDNWKTGVRREGGKNDKAIFEQLIGLIGSNSFLVEKFLKGGLDPDKGGIDVGKILTKALGDDLDDLNLDLYDTLKETLASTVYPDDEAKYEAAKAKKMDNIVFEDVIPDLLTGEGMALEGLEIKQSDSINKLLINIFNVCWAKYLVPMLNDIKIEYDENNELAMAFKDVIRLDFEGTPFDAAKKIEGDDFMNGINNLLGYVIGQFIIPAGFTWAEGGFDKIGDNVKALFEFLLEKADFSKTAYAAQAAAAKASTNIDDKALIVVKAVLSEFGEGYGDAVKDCTSFKDMAFVVLQKVAKDEMGLTNTYKKGDDYLDVAADMLVFVADKLIPMDSVKDAELEDVINYICNFYQFDRGFAKALNLKVSKTDSAYDKLNALLWIFYSDKTPKANRIDTETLLKGKGGKKSIFESIIALDIQNILDITVKTLVDSLSKYTASEFVYSIVKNVLDNLFGTEIIVAYKSPTPFDNACQNANIGAIAGNLLEALNANKSALISSGCYAALAIMDIPGTGWKISSAEKYPDGTTTVKLTGKEPDGKTAISRVLYPDKDYVLTADGIKGIKNYEGNYAVTFSTVKAPAAVTASTIKASAISATGATLTWTAVSGATGYIVKNGSTNLATVATTKYALTGLKANTTYNNITVTAYKKAANTGKVYSAAASKAVAFVTAPAAVTGIKAVPAATSTKLTWTAAKGAASYTVYNAVTKKTVTVKTNSASITGLTANTAYKFTITPINAKSAKGVAATYSTRTLPAAVTGVKASAITATSLKLTWTAVKGATSYTVYNATTKKAVTVKTNSASITGLAAGKAYKFQVRATVKDSTGTYTGAYSAAKAATTLFTQTKGLKATKATTSAISVSWTAVKGATSYKVYVNGKAYSTVKTNKATISKRAAGTTYSIYVVAYKGSVAGQASATIKVAAAPGKVTSLKGKSSGLLSKKTVTLTWKAPKGATSYNIYQGSKKIGTATKATFAVKNLKKGAKYTFYVEPVIKAANFTSTGAKASVKVTA
ncbi:MAG: fibronectin type III domain-containing protein [Clostridia bacterium]|nr:fibronectin type III domain-containing protein [Clostridia bacterium]